jgi:hypothetical protein
MKLGKAIIIRDIFTLKASAGQLSLEDFKCYTLEDVSRGENVKIRKETCLPPGLFKIILTWSNRFQRIMPVIITERNGYEARRKGISFLGARLHGGNTHKHTEGCPLVAFNRLNDELIQGTAEKALTRKLIDMGLKLQPIPLEGDFDYVELEIINQPK